MRTMLAVGAALLPTASMAQSMPGMVMSPHTGHERAPPAATPQAARRPPIKPAATRPAHPVAHGHPAAQSAGPGAADHAVSTTPDPATMPEMDHGAMSGMAMPEATDERLGTALPAGNSPAPPPPRDHYADRTFGAAAMASSRAALPHDHGGAAFSGILLNIAEYQARKQGDGYRWDGEAWFGGDINRLTIKSQGEGRFDGGAERAEVQALFSRAVDPYWNVQAGLRYDFRPNPSRTYATIGVEGLAPYWFEVEAALFLSDKGDLLGRLEAWHDMRLAQRLVLQPRAELNLAAQDMPAQRIGSGLSDAELGLRLRYEFRRELAPYVGISWERKAGDTARLARSAGRDVEATSLVIGMRASF